MKQVSKSVGVRRAACFVAVGVVTGWLGGCAASSRTEAPRIDVAQYSDMWWPHVNERGRVVGSLVGDVVRVPGGFYVDMLFSGFEGDDVLAEAREAGLLIEESLGGRRPLLRASTELELPVELAAPARLASMSDGAERRGFWPPAAVLSREAVVVRLLVRAELGEEPVRVSVGDVRLAALPRVRVAPSAVTERGGRG